MAEIVNINHETGDLTQYTSTVNPDDDLSASAGAALVGTFGFAVIIDDTTITYARKDFTQLASTAHRYRFYLDPNGLTMASGDRFQIFNILDTAALRGRVDLRFQGGAYQILALSRADDLSEPGTSGYDISDGPHYIEVVVNRASTAVASDGSLSLYIDGVLQETVSSLDIFDISQPNSVRFGAIASIDAGTSGTLYLDDLVLRDDATEIGAASASNDLDQIDIAFDPQDDSHIVVLRTTPVRTWIYESLDYGSTWQNYQVGI